MQIRRLDINNTLILRKPSNVTTFIYASFDKLRRVIAPCNPSVILEHGTFWLHNLYFKRNSLINQPVNDTVACSIMTLLYAEV